MRRRGRGVDGAQPEECIHLLCVSACTQSDKAEDGKERYSFHGVLQDVLIDGFVG